MEATIDNPVAPATPIIDPQRQHRKGGKKGAKKPDAYLRALRHVSLRPKEDDKTELHKMLRPLKENEPVKFLDRLRQAENDQKRLKEKASTGAASAPASADPRAAPVDLKDFGEEKVLGLIDGLLAKGPPP